MSDNQHRRRLAPADSPRARWFALLLALALIALGLLAAHDLAVHYLGPAGWSPWLGRVVDALRAPDPLWVGLGGVAAVIVGLSCLVAAVLPRRRAHRALTGAGAAVWVRRVDVARYTTATAKRFPGVISASSLARKRSVVVTAEIVNAEESTRRRLQEELTEAVHPVFGEDLTVRVVLRDSTEDDAMLQPAHPSSAGAAGGTS